MCVNVNLKELVIHTNNSNDNQFGECCLCLEEMSKDIRIILTMSFHTILNVQDYIIELAESKWMPNSPTWFCSSDQIDLSQARSVPQSSLAIPTEEGASWGAAWNFSVAPRKSCVRHAACRSNNLVVAMEFNLPDQFWILLWLCTWHIALRCCSSTLMVLLWI